MVICDAGGCAGNVCGFDEPRWFTKKSAVFSAGLRDMDAILGRDDRLIEKLSKACEQISPAFTAIIGTPVPAVIATDMRALRRMAEKKTGLPCITAECTGTNYYDSGSEPVWIELFKTFATESKPVQKGRLGIIGATPLELSIISPERIVAEYKAKGWENVICYGMGSTLDDVKNAAAAEMNIVCSASAIKAAEYLKEKFGTPYEIEYPRSCLPEEIVQKADKFTDKNEELDESGEGINSVLPLLRFLERHPMADISMTSAVVRYMEQFYGRGYENILMDSVRRRPTVHTVRMLGRLRNTAIDEGQDGEEFEDVLIDVLSSEAEDEIKDTVRELI